MITPCLLIGGYCSECKNLSWLFLKTWSTMKSWLKELPTPWSLSCSLSSMKLASYIHLNNGRSSKVFKTIWWPLNTLNTWPCLRLVSEYSIWVHMSAQPILGWGALLSVDLLLSMVLLSCPFSLSTPNANVDDVIHELPNHASLLAYGYMAMY